ncbi:KR domain-containing protein, partial [Streptomyces sp. NPDC006923]|uniref:KR domain-containing protein n=1 Tax=Streptomyces sp. NPDC006923 TaxID=3155355 RepID=UPI0033F103FF
VLAVGVAETVEDAGRDAVAVGTLRRGEGGLERFWLSVGEAYTAGAAVDWEAVYAGTGARRVDLPTYAFQYQRYWPEAAPAALPGVVEADATDARFWEAVEREDLESLTAELNIAGDQPVSELLPALASWRRQSRERTTLDAWRYRVTWKPLSESGSGAQRLTGTWLLVVPGHGIEDGQADDIAAALSGRGADIRRIDLGRAADRVSLAALISGTLEGTSDIGGVLSLLALDDRPHLSHPSAPEGLAATLALIQALGDAEISAPLWCATRGAVSTGAPDPLTAPAQALVRGLGRVAALEHLARWGGLVDLPETLDARALSRLADVLAGTDDEGEVAIRTAGIFGPRLARAPLAATPDVRTWRPEGTTLITGGTGALGAEVAGWLARNGAEHLLLVRDAEPGTAGANTGTGQADTAESERAEAGLVAELTAAGARVTVADCDLTDREALAALLAGVPSDQPLRAVIHTAARPDDGVIDGLTAERAAGALAVKRDATVHLHELTKDLELSAFVLFSSFAATFGAPGQGNQAPGNAFLDAFAEYRRSLGLPATSVAWGPWGDGGTAEGVVGDRMRRHGIVEMAPEPALAALQHILDRDETALTVIDMDWKRFTLAYTADRPRPLLDGLPEAVRIIEEMRADTADDGAGGVGLAQQLAGLPDTERERLLLGLVRSAVAAVLGHSGAEAIEANRAFKELGFDSLTAVELRNRLGAASGLKLPPTLIFDHPTPAAVAAHLRAEVVPDEAAGGAPLLSELDRLETVLAGSTADNVTRARVTMRLQSLLAKWNDAEEWAGPESPAVPAPGAPTGGADTVAELDSASDEELFAFINKGLGRA